MLKTLKTTFAAGLMAASALVAAPAFAADMMPKTVVDIAVGNDDFETLVAAVTAADLGAVLTGEGPFTVFAPTDDAFAALPAGTLDDLLKPENKDKLVAILTYHVIPGAVLSTDIAGQKLDVATVQGSNIAVDATDGVMINDAKVIIADLKAENGVVHVIDKVILPPM